MAKKGKKYSPPGSFQHVTTREVNGFDFTIVARGDVFECFHGKDLMYAFTLSPQAMWRVVKFLAAWWVLGTWCGLKTKLWRWAMTYRPMPPHEERIKI